MSVNDQYALNWSNHTNHIKKAFDSLLAGSEFVDVTLSCEGKKICAHKMLLSACSTYFHDLFRENPCQHPIVILKDVKFQNLIDILKFMYNGEVSVATENFDSFLKTAELLQVSGLTDDENRYGTSEKEEESTENSQPSSESSDRATVQPVPRKSSENPKETSKKRTVETSSVEEGTSQKKKKENELKSDVDIKQEEPDIINLEEENLQMRDPLEIDQQNDSTEGLDILQPAGSQNFADVQDLLNENSSVDYLEKNTRMHSLSKRVGILRDYRKYCQGCYRKFQIDEIDKSMIKKVDTYCVDCARQPNYCLGCFFDAHSNN